MYTPGRAGRASAFSRNVGGKCASSFHYLPPARDVKGGPVPIPVEKEKAYSPEEV